MKNLTELLSWEKFKKWLQKLIMNSECSQHEITVHYHAAAQHKNQSVSDFVNHVQNLKNRLSMSFADEQWKYHIYMKVLSIMW